MTKSVALYARVSTPRQADGDLSIPDQKRAIAAYCKTRGWAIIAEYVDAGVSATDDNRPEFQRMIDDAVRGTPGFNMIVVHSYSRYYRDNWQAELYRRRLKKCGVEVASITQEFGDGPTADLIRQFIGLMDEHQSKENAKHTLRGMEENARQGFVNGIAPFGYRSVVTETRGTKAKKRLEIEPEEAEVVRLIFRLAQFGTTGVEPAGVKTIVKELNRRGLTTRSGHAFTTKTVHDILHRTAYVGRYVFNVTDSRTAERKPIEKQIVVTVPSIVDEAVFEAVHAAMQERDPMRVAIRFAPQPTLLSSLARCGKCGGAMSLRSGKSGRYRYYTCSTARRQGDCGCSGRTIRESLLDGLIVDHLAEFAFEPHRLRRVLEDVIQAELDAQREGPRLLDNLQSRKADIEGRISRMHQAIERGLVDFDDAEFTGRLRQLKAQRLEVNGQMQALKASERSFPPLTASKIREFSRVLRSSLHTGDVRTRRAYIKLFVERIIVHDREIRVRGRASTLAEAYAQDWEREVLPQVDGWRPLGDSNPCYRRERAMSWASRRRGLGPCEGGV